MTQRPPAPLEVERPTAALPGSPEQRRPVVPRSRRARLRRTVLIAGLVAGILVAVDGALTIAWQEPVTAYLQSRSQAQLRDDLAQLQRSFARADAQRAAEAHAAARRAQDAARADAVRMRRDAIAMLARPDGSAVGTLDIPRIGLKTVVVEATDHASLMKGPGHYRGTALPGMPGTVGLAGHRTTYGAPFRHVDALRPGARIVLRMPYGRFVYRVTGTRITTPDDASALQRQHGAPGLVLTACHPLYSAAKRIVVSARQVASTPA